MYLHFCTLSDRVTCGIQIEHPLEEVSALLWHTDEPYHKTQYGYPGSDQKVCEVPYPISNIS